MNPRQSKLKAIALLSAALITEAFAEDKEKLNVVLIMADDVGYECFSAYGSKEFSTPRLDALAGKGMRFDHCHSTPLCTPSRVNLMTGKSNVFNYVDFGVFPEGEPTFANYFKDHGYVTAVAGKWQLMTSNSGISPVEAGFDRHCVWNIPGTDRSRYWKPSLMHDGEVINHGEDEYGSTIIADYLVDFIRENQEKPFLVYYPMNLPHNPFDPTPLSKDRESRDGKQNFIDMVAYMDYCVGRIEDALIELGLRENTLMIFTADNGTNSSLSLDFFGTERKGGKGYTHDHGTKVPLILNLPGRIPGGEVNEDLICFSDLFPTIVEAAGLPEKEISRGDGWSFWPQCLGNEGTKREWIYGYYFPRPFSKKFDTMYSHWEVAWARNKRYKLYRDGRFYDVIDDVREEKALGEPEELRDVRLRLQATMDEYPEKGAKIDYERVTGERKAPGGQKKKAETKNGE
ncbi:MAG: sulfatase-like hydrolase/transferase [Verrucomicrobiota bacterium]